MPLPIRLEPFCQSDTPDPGGTQASEAAEEVKLAAYERGYVAGWEDAERQAGQEGRDRRAAVERQLEGLSFTYHEARGHVLRALEPVLDAMLATIVPEAARASIVPEVIGQILPLAHDASEAPVTLQIGPGMRAEFDAALRGLVLPPLDIRESPDLRPEQAEIAFDTRLTRVDLSHAAEALRGAIARYYQIQFEESRHAS
ncbi:MAG: flagellar assembly protein FliH [Rhodobacteraceae bacterium HLUCCA12]|nr:MAG: flagellar assembly protein FliH [Rhodobacteraceae bacterium HLUCCA12]